MIKNILIKAFELKRRKHYKRAIETFYKALEFDNKSAELLLEIADTYYKMNNAEKALNYVEQALSIDAFQVNALKFLRKIFMDKNALDKAEQISENIYCITKSDCDLAELLSVLNMQKKYEEVLNYENKNTNPDIVHQQSIALFKLDRKRDAITMLREGLAQNIDNQKLLAELCKIYFSCNDMNECNKLFHKLICPEDDPEMLNLFGLIYTANNNYNDAYNCYLKALKTSPKRDDLYYNLANCCIESGKYTDAKKYYNMAISINPNDEYYHYALAKLYYKEKKYKKALEELNSNILDSRLLRVVILCDAGYYSIAQKEIDELLIEYPDNEILKKCREKIAKTW